MKENELLTEEQELVHNIFSIGVVYMENICTDGTMWRVANNRWLEEITDTGEWRTRTKVERKDYKKLYAMYRET